MFGPRIGLAVGLRTGLAVGVGADEIGAAATSTTLTVALSDSADPVITAVAYSYALIVTNTGGVSATTVTASVTLDASLAYVSASGTGWTVDASLAPVISFTRATLAVGAAPTITVNVTSGGSALTASTTSGASASNASAATPSVQTTVVKLVAKDATSGIRVPATSTQWTDFIAYAGLGITGPNSLWLCQEASGNLADSIGSLTLTAGSAPSYQTAATGWTRVGVSLVDGSVSKFVAAAGLGPNPTTTSSLWIWFATLPSVPAATRGFITIGGTTTGNDAGIVALSTSKVRNRCVGVAVDGTSNPYSAGVQPYAYVYDRTGSRAVAYTGQEKIAGTYSASVLDGDKGIGGALQNTPAATFVYGVMFSGAAGELSDANVKALLQAMGVVIPWS